MEKDAHFGPKIKLLSNAFEQMLNQRLAAQNITSAQSYFLHFLHKKELQGVPVHSKDIAEAFQLKHSTVSGILQRLEANDFLSFVPDACDHRLKCIVLSEKAHCGQQMMRDAFDRLEKRMLTGFTEEEAALFYRFLLRASDNIGTVLPQEMKKRGNDDK